MQKLLISLLILSFIFSFPNQIYAQSENNKFGIHILNESELTEAASLVNSNGGDWGYVTIVIREDERDSVRWQKVFDELRRKHLIPIVRTATSQTSTNWTKPDLGSIPSWVSFFNSLNWVTKDRLITIGNEPNHAKEWGGVVNPKEYADFYYAFSKELENSNQDYVVMPAGFDASAPNDSTHMSEDSFIKWMIATNSNVFEYTDAWASHSYPNPNFSGSAKDTGRGTVKTYEWELSLLAELGVTKELPVYITETGWAHSGSGDSSYKSTTKIAEEIEYAFTNVWNDGQVRAVTPFILSYKDAPFDIFSWKDTNGKPHTFYEKVMSMAKPKGAPVRIQSADVLSEIVPEFIEVEDKKFAIAQVKNTGQSIWERKEQHRVTLGDGTATILPPNPFRDIEPGQEALVLISEDKKVLGMQFAPFFDTIFAPIANLKLFK
jgi:hypothetical protein